MNKNDLRSQSLDLLRFPLAVVVVIIHIFNTNGLTMPGTSISLEGMPILLGINHFLDGFLRGQSVPIYFFISGFVFFLGVDLTKEKYLQKLKNRMNTLLIPYLIWNVIAVLWGLFKLLPSLSSLLPGANETHLDFSLSAVLFTFWDASKGIIIRPEMPGEVLELSISPQNAPLWFVRDLMIVVLCTPLLYWVLKRTRHYVVFLLGVLYFVLQHWDLGYTNQLLTAFFFFSWGAYFSVNKKDMMQEFGRFFKASMILYPLLGLLYVASVYYFPDVSSTIKGLNILVGLFFAYNISAWLLTHQICKVSPFLASASFFIYISHALICNALLKLLFIMFRPVTDWGMISIHVLAVVFTVSSLLLAFYLLRRYTPSLLKIIAGRK